MTSLEGDIIILSRAATDFARTSSLPSVVAKRTNARCMCVQDDAKNGQFVTASRKGARFLTGSASIRSNLWWNSLAMAVL